MDAQRWLRPRARPAFLSAGFIVGGLWALLGAFTAYAAVWWPGHAILKNTAAGALGGMAGLSSILALPFACGWLWVRQVTWRVGAGGIEVFRRGTLRRTFDWSEITALHVLPFYAVARSAAHPFGEEIFWLAAEDVSWLREIAKDRLGQRLVA
jgi:hypothetical protein